MSDKLNDFEIEVLRMLNGEKEIQWGAWVGACLEYLSDGGYCTRSPNYEILPRGKQYLAGLVP